MLCLRTAATALVLRYLRGGFLRLRSVALVHREAPNRITVRVRVRGGYVPTTVTRLVRCDKRV